MRYLVTGGDGKSYGPVDIDTLRHWIREGRVNRETELRDEESGAVLRAGEVEELREALAGAAGGPQGSWSYPLPPCSHCGRPFDRSSGPVCPNCGSPAFGPIDGKLMTGNETGDKVLGFVVGFGSMFVYGVGWLVAAILYFVLRPTYPRFARGLGFGLASVLVILLGLFAVCVVSLPKI